jgi:hypothetical protein
MKTTDPGRTIRTLGMVTVLALLPSLASSQQGVPEAFLQESITLGEGWRGFADFGFLLNALFTLSLATVLGATVAYHPKHRQTADTLEEIEAPKVYVLYSVIGALIGIMVVKYGLVVGFVLFGIGGLIRFRTLLRSAVLTGHVIFVTLIGLSCGLDLPHVAVLASAFGFGLIYLLDSHVTYRIDIRGLPLEGFAAAAAQYRELLEGAGCRILNEKKNPGKQRAIFIFRINREVGRPRLEDLLETKIDPSVRGSVNWEMD